VGWNLSHYTTESALDQILREGALRSSSAAQNPNDARFGDGVYLTDIEPGTLTLSKLSRRLLGNPFQGKRFTHFLAIETDGLDILAGRPHIFVILSIEPLELKGRIVGYGSSLIPLN
jgi:hypothetical protein